MRREVETRDRRKKRVKEWCIAQYVILLQLHAVLTCAGCREVPVLVRAYYKKKRIRNQAHVQN